MGAGNGKAAADGGWCLEGNDGDGRPLRILIGEAELARSYLGVTVGRHPLLCERVIDDPGVSRRHFRIARGGDGLLVEDVNSLNGTYLDDQALPPFVPVPLHAGQVIVAGHVVLSVGRLAEDPGA